MRVWIDLANSPHVALFEPVFERLRTEGAEVVLTAREHAQTADLARRAFREVHVVGGESPRGRTAKARSIASRARALVGVSRTTRPDVAVSHGSYAQVLAARATGVPAVTMMDYEFQPANHLSFRIADRVVVPKIFPTAALRRFGARERKVVRYDGFKEELYLGTFQPSSAVLSDLGLNAAAVVAVMRPPPEGALYHRGGNDHFERLLSEAERRTDVQVVVLPRLADEAAAYRGRPRLIVPERAVDGRSLLAYADVMIGAGGTMNREAAILGTPAYTVFSGRLAAVDAELMRRGLMYDLRDRDSSPSFAKKKVVERVAAHERAEGILRLVVRTLETTARSHS